jgi:hypothetical protein
MRSNAEVHFEISFRLSFPTRRKAAKFRKLFLMVQGAEFQRQIRPARFVAKPVTVPHTGEF